MTPTGCEFFDPFRFSSPSTPHYCHRENISIAPCQVRLNCTVFIAADANKQAELWNRFDEGNAAIAQTPDIEAAEAPESLLTALPDGRAEGKAKDSLLWVFAV